MRKEVLHIPLALILLIFSACNNSDISDISLAEIIGKPCFENLHLSKVPSYDYGKWTYQRIYNTSLIACLPEDSWSATRENDVDGPTTLHIPANNSQVARIESYETDDPLVLVYLKKEVVTESSSIKDWLINNVSGSLENVDHCITSIGRDPKKLTDYQSPYFINFQSSIISLDFEKGDFVRYEACRDLGTKYGLFINGEVFLIGYEHGFDPKNKSGEELLQAILRTLRFQHES